MRDNCNLTYKQIKDYLLSTKPIGALEINLTGQNPSEYIGGTWVLIEDNTFIASKGLVNSGNYGGSNDSVVVEHSHSEESSGSHSHTTGNASGTTTGKFHTSAYAGDYTGIVSNITDNGGNASTSLGGSQKDIYFDISGHTHTTDSQGSHTHTINNTGENGTNKNMPKYLACYIFRRTA